jgi:hypothetical protein
MDIAVHLNTASGTETNFKTSKKKKTAGRCARPPPRRIQRPVLFRRTALKYGRNLKTPFHDKDPFDASFFLKDPQQHAAYPDFIYYFNSNADSEFQLSVSF